MPEIISEWMRELSEAITAAVGPEYRVYPEDNDGFIRVNRNDYGADVVPLMDIEVEEYHSSPHVYCVFQTSEEANDYTRFSIADANVLDQVVKWVLDRLPKLTRNYGVMALAQSWAFYPLSLGRGGDARVV